MSNKLQIKRSKLTITITWIAGLLSVGLLLLSGNILVSDVGSFRSCNNDSTLHLSNCGKQSVDSSDVLIFILFVIAAVLVVVLFSEAWRMTKGNHGKK
jgi:hypothetical protein